MNLLKPKQEANYFRIKSATSERLQYTRKEEQWPEAIDCITVKIPKNRQDKAQGNFNRVSVYHNTTCFYTADFPETVGLAEIVEAVTTEYFNNLED